MFKAAFLPDQPKDTPCWSANLPPRFMAVIGLSIKDLRKAMNKKMERKYFLSSHRPTSEHDYQNQNMLLSCPKGVCYWISLRAVAFG